jgi:hypothetical protein
VPSTPATWPSGGHAEADFTAYLMLAWDLVSEKATHRRWTCYDPDTRALERELHAAVAP